jgi:hypothetical protein
MKDSEPERALEYQGRLDQIESSINRIRVPLTFFGEVYWLKEYVDSVRGRLARLRDPSKENNSWIHPKLIIHLTNYPFEGLTELPPGGTNFKRIDSFSIDTLTKYFMLFSYWCAISKSCDEIFIRSISMRYFYY